MVVVKVNGVWSVMTYNQAVNKGYRKFIVLT